MNPTDILMDEHRVIEQVLNCLEKIIEQATAAGRLEEEPAREALDFFRTFADRCHHGKEEAHLFPLMQTRGFGGGWRPRGGYAAGTRTWASLRWRDGWGHRRCFAR